MMHDLASLAQDFRFDVPAASRSARRFGAALPQDDTRTAARRWETVFFADLDVIRNDHRNIGLWYYNIPTVFVFSHTISPMFYALAKRYLACEGDRALLNLCCPNARILRLLGVSYVTLGRHPNP